MGEEFDLIATNPDDNTTAIDTRVVFPLNHFLCYEAHEPPLNRAGVEQLVETGNLNEDMRVVVVLTGSGAKWGTAAAASAPIVSRIHGTPVNWARWVTSWIATHSRKSSADNCAVRSTTRSTPCQIRDRYRCCSGG